MPSHGRWFCMTLLPLLLTILPASSPSGLDRRPAPDTREQVEVSGALRVIAFRTASVDPAVAQSFTALRNAVIRRDTERTGHVKPGIPVAEAVPEQVVVQMRAPKCDDGALSAALTGSKSRVLSHVSTCSFVVLCESVGAVLSLEAHPDIGWVGPMLPEYKTAPELAARAPAGAAGSRRREAAEAAAANATRVWLDVILAATPDAALRGRWEAALSRAVAPGVASVTRDSARAAVVECAAADLAPVARWLAQQWEVLWLEERAEARRLNFHALYNAGAPGELAANASGLAARGIDGRGEVPPPPPPPYCCPYPCPYWTLPLLTGGGRRRLRARRRPLLLPRRREGRSYSLRWSRTRPPQGRPREPDAHCPPPPLLVLSGHAASLTPY
jgi:hypothetical protein